VTDARGSTTTYGYDTMDRMTRRADPLQRAETYAYDAASNLSMITDRKGQLTTYAYDGLNRVTQVTYPDQSTTTYTYDAGNRLTQIADSLGGTTTRTYDALDRLITEVTPEGTVRYTYDAIGDFDAAVAASVAFLRDILNRERPDPNNYLRKNACGA
jgi:YD repeat-containing protein